MAWQTCSDQIGHYNNNCIFQGILLGEISQSLTPTWSPNFRGFKGANLAPKGRGTGMEYHFNIEYAKKYGVDEAIMIQNFVFWIMKNKANHTHQHEDRTWTYNTKKAFVALFPFWDGPAGSCRSISSQGSGPDQGKLSLPFSRTGKPG